jgi:hypothetical protein
LKVEGQGQGGPFTGDAGEVAIALPLASIEAKDSLEKLLTVIAVRDDVLLEVTDTLAATQGLSEELAKDIGKLP